MDHKFTVELADVMLLSILAGQMDLTYSTRQAALASGVVYTISDRTGALGRVCCYRDAGDKVGVGFYDLIDPRDDPERHARWRRFARQVMQAQEFKVRFIASLRDQNDPKPSKQPDDNWWHEYVEDKDNYIDIIDLWRAGHTAKEIGDHVTLSPGRVRNLITDIRKGIDDPKLAEKVVPFHRKT